MLRMAEYRHWDHWDYLGMGTEPHMGSILFFLWISPFPLLFKQFFCLFVCFNTSSQKHPKGFPGGSEGKESADNAGDPDSIPGSGRSPGEGNGNPLQYSSLKHSMERGAWQAIQFMGLQRVRCEWLTFRNILMGRAPVISWKDLAIWLLSPLFLKKPYLMPFIPIWTKQFRSHWSWFPRGISWSHVFMAHIYFFCLTFNSK